MKSGHILIFVCTSLLMLLTACSNTKTQEEPTPVNIANTDVNWKGSSLGLVPTLSKDALSELDQSFNNRDEATAMHLDQLDDPNTFVVYHVILTRLYVNDLGYPPFNDTQWNHMTVKLDKNGNAVYEPDERLKLKQYWVDYLKKLESK